MTHMTDLDNILLCFDSWKDKAVDPDTICMRTIFMGIVRLDDI